MDWINPLDALADGIKSLLGQKLTPEEYKKLGEEVDKKYKENQDRNGGEYNYWDSAIGTPFEGIMNFFRGVNDVFMEIIMVPKYIYESAQKNPSLIASVLVGVVGLLWIFKKRIF